MKRSVILFLFSICAVTAGSAQLLDGVEISLSSGLAMPSSPMSFAEYWKMRYGANLAVGIPLSPTITITGMVEHYQFALKEAGVRDQIDVEYLRRIWLFNDVALSPSADPSSVTTVSANLRIAPAARTGWISPHATAGVGVLFFSMSDISVPTTSVLTADGMDVTMTALRTIRGGDETMPFFQIGLGLDVRLMEGAEVFLEGRYVHGISKGLGTAYMPITAGVRYAL